MYHVEKIHGPQEHFCKHCPFSVFMIEGFKEHMETAHPEKAGRYIYQIIKLFLEKVMNWKLCYELKAMLWIES